MRIPALITTALLLVVASTSAAQSTLVTADLAPLDATRADPVDDDGNPDTLAWLLVKKFTTSSLSQRRQLVVLQPNGTLCFEDPFVASENTFDVVGIRRSGRRDVIVVNTPEVWWGWVRPYKEISIDRRRCR